MSVSQGQFSSVSRQRAAFFACIRDTLGEPQSDFALVDFPDHRNIGDSAIYVGELDAMETLGFGRPSYVCTRKNYRGNLEKYCPNGPILMHGGGNFGHLYPSHQELRNSIFERYGKRKIVLLPQSIHFDTGPLLEETRRVIDKASDVTLLVRDHESEAFANRHFDCRVMLCPDAAFGMQVPEHLPSADTEWSLLLRSDKEAKSTPLHKRIQTLGTPFDWYDLPQAKASNGQRYRDKIANLGFSYGRSGMAKLEQCYSALARSRVFVGLARLGKGKAVVSDRLHAHILSSLIGRQQIILDNSYGKISRYQNTWDTQDSGTLVDSVAGFELALGNLSQQVANSPVPPKIPGSSNAA